MSTTQSVLVEGTLQGLQLCDTGHNRNQGVSSYLDFLQKVEKLRNENHLRCSTYVSVFRSFVLFVCGNHETAGRAFRNLFVF